MGNENNEKSQVYRELLIFALGELICLALMLGIFGLLGRLDSKVLLGGAIGVLLAVGNYFLMAVGVFRAAEKAQQGDVQGGQRVMSLSMLGRYLFLILVLVAGAKSGFCNVIAMLVPLVLTRVLIMIGEFFRKKDG
ncbi:MAG: ATP synthase subunit I [Oscillospiraceae bacterium]|nr:ATP synthase subunit I [Oscillospiraceae bacterium]